jgi:uncharacterized protein (TIGR00725 family)
VEEPAAEQPRIIAVVGGGNVGTRVLEFARQLGAEIARDSILLTGGDGSKAHKAVKDAAVKGAQNAFPSSARIISILQEPGGLTSGSGTVRSGLLHGRNVLNAVAADAMIVLEGQEGTLSEAAFAYMTGRRVILFGGAEQALRNALDAAKEQKNFATIAEQSSKLQHALPVRCTAEAVQAAAQEALTKAFKTSDVKEAVDHARKAPLLASFPAVEGVDAAAYQALLKRFGR